MAANKTKQIKFRYVVELLDSGTKLSSETPSIKVPGMYADNPDIYPDYLLQIFRDHMQAENQEPMKILMCNVVGRFTDEVSKKRKTMTQSILPDKDWIKHFGEDILLIL